LKQQQMLHLKALKLAPVIIPEGQKGPTKRKWNKKAAKWKKIRRLLPSINVGIIHKLSGTCCFDVDNLKKAKEVPLLVKHIMNGSGLEYSSGVPNKFKSLYRLPADVPSRYFKTHSLPGGCGQFRCGNVQDVLPGSVHPSGSVYAWTNGGASATEIPVLPSSIVSLMVEEYKAGRKARNNKKATNSSGHVFIDVYNKWFMSGGAGSLLDKVHAFGGYEYAGFNTLRRLGSGNKHSVVMYNDADGVSRCYNFSDTEGSGLLPGVGTYDPYGVLGVEMGFDEARRYVTVENKVLAGLVDKAMGGLGSLEGKVGVPGVEGSTAAESGVLFDPGGVPMLAEEFMMPPGSRFAKLVESVMFHSKQEANPNMAFWFSLVLVDYLAGGGYDSFQNDGMNPLYVFTSGLTSNGKTQVIQSGEKHIRALRGVGKVAEGGGFTSEVSGSDSSSSSEPFVAEKLLNKKLIDEVGSVQGIMDVIGKELGHGCDILYTHDEWGIENKRGSGGGSEDAARTKAFIMKIKSIGRSTLYKYRLKAKNNVKKGEEVGQDISCVHFNYFTSATNESLRGVLSGKDGDTGFIQRFIGGPSITPLTKARVDVYGSPSPGSGDKVSRKVLKILGGIVDMSSSVLGVDRETGGVRIGCGPGVVERIANLSREVFEANRSGDIYKSKMLENILPVARARAIIECSGVPVVTLEVLGWAEAVVRFSIVYFRWLLGEITDKPVVEVGLLIEKSVMSFLEKYPTNNVKGLWTRREMIQRSNIAKYGAAVYGPIIEAMVNEELIMFEKVDLVGSGRPKNCVRLANG